MGVIAMMLRGGVIAMMLRGGAISGLIWWESIVESTCKYCDEAARKNLNQSVAA
jgi:hypothetical protein